jgi:hypothetical protein
VFQILSNNVSLRFAAPNIDGLFNSGDLVHVIQVGEYEDVIESDPSFDRLALDIWVAVSSKYED